MGRDPLFWCGNLAIRRRPRPSRWGCLSPAFAAAPYPWRPAARPAPASPLPGPQLRRAPRRPAAQPWDRRSTPPCARSSALSPAASALLATCAAPCTPPSAPGHGRISPRCVPEGASDEKNTSSWQYIAAMYSDSANFGKICVLCIQKAPQSAAGEYAARTSCHQGAFSPSEALKSCMAHKSCHPLMNLALAQG